MKIIESAHNIKIKQLNKWLGHSKYRKKDAVMVLEGNHLLGAFLDSKQMPEAIFVPKHKHDQPEVQALLSQVDAHLIYLVSDGLLHKISSLDNAEEIITVVKQPESTKWPLNEDCVLLEAVQDPGNVGTILRSALASGVKNILLSPEAADVFSPKVLRAAMGAHFSLALFTNVNLQAFLQEYQGQKLATSLGQKTTELYQTQLNVATAWIVGNEGAGVSFDLQQAADSCVKIPMQGQTESLNVAMATTICLFEQMRQRFYKG